MYIEDTQKIDDIQRDTIDFKSLFTCDSFNSSDCSFRLSFYMQINFNN